MFNLLIELHCHRQLLKVDEESVRSLVRRLSGHVRQCGAGWRDLGGGQYLAVFTIRRPGDARFVIDSVTGLRTMLDERRTDLAGYTLIMESGDDSAESERRIRKLLVRAVVADQLWVGPLIRPLVAGELELEASSAMARVIGLRSEPGYGLSVIEAYRRVLPLDEFSRWIATSAEAFRGLRERQAASGDARTACDTVDLWIERFLPQQERWLALSVPHVIEDGEGPSAVAKYLVPAPWQALQAALPPDAQASWRRLAPFLGLSGHSCVIGCQPPETVPEYPAVLFREAFRLYLQALGRLNAAQGRPLIIHLEHRAGSRSLFDEFMDGFRPWLGSQDEFGVLMIHTGTDTALGASLDRCRIQPSGSALSDIPVGVPDGLRRLCASARLSPLEQAMAGYLARWHAVHTDAIVPDSSATMNSEPAFSFLIPAILTTCDDIVRDVWRVLRDAGGRLPPDSIHDVLVAMDIERIRHPALIRTLFELGLVRNEETLIVTPECTGVPDGLAPSDTGLARKALAEYLAQRIVSGKLPPSYDGFLAARLCPPSTFLTYASAYLGQLIDAGQAERAGELLAAHVAASAGESASTSLVKEFLGLRIAMAADRALNTRLSVPTGGEPVEPAIASWATLQSARAAYRSNDLPESLALAKKALLGFQDIDDAEGLAAAQNLFGQLLAAKERLIEAHDYFILSRNNATSTSGHHQDIMAAAFDTAVGFLLGYHSRTLEALADTQGVIENARTHGRMGIVMYLEFLRGRVWFELGDYAAARSAFEIVLMLCERFEHEPAAALARRWGARCLIFLGNPDKAIVELSSVPNCRESFLFMAEASIVAEDWAAGQRALHLFEAEPANVIRDAEFLSWEDGFAWLESRISAKSGEDALSRLAFCYAGLCQVHRGNAAEAVTALRDFTRDKNRWLADPLLHVYLYVFALAAQASIGPAADDGPTILGKAIKALQERASRIEDPAHKQAFLRSSYWNRRLALDARRYNLA